MKEYRIDRMMGDKKNFIKAILPKTAIIAIILLLLSFIFAEPVYAFLWEITVSAIFYLLGAYSIFLAVKTGWKFPKPTKKTLLLMIVCFGGIIYSSIFFINIFPLFMVILEISITILTFLLVEIIQIPTFFIKKIIYKIAKNKISKFKNLIVIGITGSYGKSSTKEFLYAILSHKYKVLKTTGNINTEIGVAQTVIKKLKPEHQIFIVEMGAYRKGEIALLCDIVKPTIGIVTGVNEQHLSLFGSLENLLSAEGGHELSSALPEGGTLFVNGDNKYCLDLYKKFAENKKVYSLSNKIVDSDIWANSITVHKNNISFIAIDKFGNLAHFGANVLGKQNVENLLGAILVAKEIGMNFGEISEGCKNVSQNTIGMVLKNGKYGIDIIDSSYSSNPDGVIADINYLSIFPNKKVVVMPCLIELGKSSSIIHEKIGRKMGEVCDLVIITNKDKFKEIKKGFDETKKNKAKIMLHEKPKNIYSAITLFCKAGDAVLLEGRVPNKLIDLLLSK